MANQKKVFFISDLHLNHGNIIKYSKRPFLSKNDQSLLDKGLVSWSDRSWRPDRESIDLMDDTIINNINAAVGENDDLWFLGDFCFAPRDFYYETARRYRNRINCRNMFLIRGNHDKKNIDNLFKGAFDLVEVTVEGQLIILCHYAMKTWNKSHHGSYHLYGHSHGSLPDDPNSLSFDCGIDCQDYKPLSFVQVQNIMSKKTWKPVDHHGGRD